MVCGALAKPGNSQRLFLKVSFQVLFHGFPWFRRDIQVLFSIESSKVGMVSETMGCMDCCPPNSFDMFKSLRIGRAFIAVQNLEPQKTLNPNNLNSKSLRIGSVFMHPVTST
jgi:hypothetical protein